MRDPYEVLGVAPGAGDDEIKKAYRTQCKRWHPDLNQGDPTAEERFKEVQAAYDMVMKQRQGGPAGFGGYGGPGYTGYTSQQQGGRANYGPYGGFYYGPFGGFGGFGGFSAGDFSGAGQSGPRSEPTALQAARNYLQSRRYREALNALSSLPENERTARWYYYSALANAGLGNTLTAAGHARRAAELEPGNPEYRRVVDALSGQNDRYENFSRAYGVPSMNLVNSFCLPTLLVNLFCPFACFFPFCWC